MRELVSPINISQKFLKDSRLLVGRGQTENRRLASACASANNVLSNMEAISVLNRQKTKAQNFISASNDGLEKFQRKVNYFFREVLNNLLDKYVMKLSL